MLFFLSSDLSSYVTGQVVRVDSGDVMTITSEKIKEIKIFSNNIRSNILEMAFTAGSNSSHFGGALFL